jgi:hypothetical protein
MPAPPGTMVHTIMDKALQFIQEPKNRERIQTQCIDPLLHHILDRMFPYIILTCILFSLILLMSLTSVGLLIFQMRQSILTATGVAAANAALATVSAPALSIPAIIQTPL